MSRELIIVTILGTLAALAVIYVAGWPPLRRAIILKWGRAARAVVMTMSRPDVRRDGAKYDMELEVHVKDEPPYVVKLTAFLTWLDGHGEKLIGRNLDVRVYEGRPSWVTIVGPMPAMSEASASAPEPSPSRLGPSSP
jgi:hypothetical protein